ncbi:MAG: TonB family protein [Verrucomicrobia bacterium]|nr:TonB family protein [Verrucomicrobiota bacterium]
MNRPRPGTAPADRHPTHLPWRRHVAAALVSLALNTLLLLGLAWAQASGTRPAERLLPTMPLRVVEPPKQPPEPAPPPSKTASESEVTPPARPALARPQPAPLQPLEPSVATLDSGALALPPFTPSAIPFEAFPSPLPEASSAPAAAAAERTTRGAVLIQPPDLGLFYPYRARVNAITGTTRLRLRIAADGSVTGAEVLSDSPPGVFAAAARRVARALRFEPALDRGRPVASETTMTIEWRLPE